MKKILCLVIAIMLILICVGCTKMETVQETQQQPTSDTSMFVLIESGRSDVGYRIVYHKETKVMYAISAGYYNTGTFTVMLDADGKPLLWEEE
jgi:hypothetical protein